ncbi:unnamed protein product [Sphagnum jensenii]|uniref:Uncharacterized protein n=1 Tax=Sphagnum jensenii TaxID=128206 RepID=A0ABP0VIN2_9BRYO
MKGRRRWGGTYLRGGRFAGRLVRARWSLVRRVLDGNLRRRSLQTSFRGSSIAPLRSRLCASSWSLTSFRILGRGRDLRSSELLLPLFSERNSWEKKAWREKGLERALHNRSGPSEKTVGGK